MHTFTTPGPITAVLDIPAGRIQVIAADRAETTVEIRPADPGKGRDVKLAEQITAAYADGTLRITAPDGNRIVASARVTCHRRISVIQQVSAITNLSARRSTSRRVDAPGTGSHVAS